jgi:multiple sugar transport system substrate-binding protein
MANQEGFENLDNNRRRLLQAGIGATALGIFPGAGRGLARAQGAFDWKRYKGEKIELFMGKTPRGELLTKHLKEFEDLTGISVGSEMVPEQQQRQKAVIEFNSGNPSFDVITVSYAVQKRLFGKSKWTEDLRPLLADKSLTDPGLDFADFPKGGMTWATQTDGRIDGLPSSIDPWLVYYNKELFDARNVAYPKSFPEMIEAAAKLHDPAKGICGFVGRGLKNANVPLWSCFFLGNGGVFVDANGKLLTDSAAAIDAAKMYQTLLAKSGPQGVAGFNWNESQSLFMQGKAAMWIDGIGFSQPLEDPTKSRVVGKVGYGVMPPGPKQHATANFGEGQSISSFSKKKGPSWLFLQWATNKTNQVRMLQTAAGAPVRSSSYADPATFAGMKVPKQWIECMMESARIAQPGLPVIVPVTEFRDILGIALTNTINGADPATELKNATAEFQPVLDKSEKA